MAASRDSTSPVGLDKKREISQYEHADIGDPDAGLSDEERAAIVCTLSAWFSLLWLTRSIGQEASAQARPQVDSLGS